jgi:hypothetical protein
MLVADAAEVAGVVCAEEEGLAKVSGFEFGEWEIYHVVDFGGGGRREDVFHYGESLVGIVSAGGVGNGHTGDWGTYLKPRSTTSRRRI